ncbi:MAG: PilZ domain-containing protein [Proteobacteria bacterium]|nr:PilZ domain-containing protein [Pseudomonadota bacterium]
MRVPVALVGRAFYPPDDRESDCIVTDISLGGATLQCGRVLPVGSEIVLYLEGFGRFRGTVVRSDAEETGMHFDASDDERVRTAENIVLYLSGVRLQETELRRNDRIGAPRRFERASGELVGFEIRDISFSGASFISAVRPPVGEIVLIGTVEGRVTRHFDDGFALEFLR